MQPLMSYSQDVFSMMGRFGQCHLNAYLDDGGIVTIGYGHTATTFPTMRITQEQAIRLLRDDIWRTVYWVNMYAKVKLTQAQFDALVDFAFTIGTGNFKQSTLLRKLNASDFEGAAAEFESWDSATGIKSATLFRRKKAEQLFLVGLADAQVS